MEKPVLPVLWGLLASYRLQVGFLCLLAATSVTLSFSPHCFVWWLGGELLEKKSVPAPEVLLLACCALVAGLAGRYVFAGVTSVGSHFIAFKVQRDIRQKLAEKLAAVPLGFLETQRRGELNKLAVDDVEGLEDGLAHLIPETAACTVAPLVLISVMFVVDWRMAIAALLPIAASFLLLGHLMKKGEEATRRYQEGLAEIGATVQETIAAFPLVKTHGADNIILGKAEEAFCRFGRETGAWIDRALVPSVWFQVLTTSAPATVLPVGIVLHLNGTLSLSSLILFLVLALSLGNVFATMGSLSHRIANQKDTFRRIAVILDEPELPVTQSNHISDGHQIDFENVRFGYGDEDVLQDFNLSIREGESLALVGPSGSGKSTVLKLLSRFWDVSAGRIKIGGIDVREMAPESLSGAISVVFQDVFLFSRSVRENIRLGHPDANDAQVIEAAIAAQAHDFIVDLRDQYDTVLEEGGRNLSGGQRQRLSIARAILHNAPILLLDEATAYADPQNERLVQLALSELAKHKTVVVIAHRLNSIKNVDRIVVMDKGRIVDQGTHDDLTQRCDLYSKMWTDQAAIADFAFGTSVPLEGADKGEEEKACV